MTDLFHKAIAEHLAVIQGLATQQPILARIADAMSRALVSGKKVLWCGNGGSAADSQHFAAVSRTLSPRAAGIRFHCSNHGYFNPDRSWERLWI
jgi:phosphoheptose isomerase